MNTLLEHWAVRRPLGPCRYGIGSRFMQVEFPMFRYNLFFYVYVLSFYLCRDFGPENVGMLTGDASVNPDAPIICCTAEILANLEQ